MRGWFEEPINEELYVVDKHVIIVLAKHSKNDMLQGRNREDKQ